MQHDLLITFGSAAFLGVFFIVLAKRLGMSAIVVLLLGGILVGPEFIGLVHPEHLGNGLGTIISLAVGLILFEGGLTLDLHGYRQVSNEIWGVLTIGVVCTWLGTTLALKLFFGFDWVFCLFAASLVIVTGPTVIGPLLGRIRVRKNLHHILHWEGVLIDPIGVFIALLCFEYVVTTGSGHQLFDFMLRFAVGAGLGLVSGYILYQILKREWVPEKYLNIWTLAWAILTFSVSDYIIAESGLLAVTVAGLLVGSRDLDQIERIISYKVELKDFLIGLLFVLLAANLKLAMFTEYGLGLVWVVLAIMFVVRPLNIFLSTLKSSLNLKEKLFLSWIAPRGIVAASMASVFAFRLADNPNAAFLETFTYSVIGGTVIIQGFSAKLVGRVLDVLEPKPNGWIIVGAHRLGRAMAAFIKECGYSVVVLDSNPREIRLAARDGLETLCMDAMNVDPEHEARLYGCGNFLAVTSNENLNRMLCDRWSKLLPGSELYSWEKEGLKDGLKARLLMDTGVWHEHELQRWMGPGDEPLPVEQQMVGISETGESDRILLSFAGNCLTLGAPPEGARPAVTLVLKLEVSKTLSKLPVRAEHVFFCGNTDLEGLYVRMLNLAGDTVPNLKPESMMADLRTRLDEFTSLLGHQISMVHTYSEEVDEAYLLVARPRQAIPCQHTGSDINLVFMLISPEDRPSEHLGHISRIAKLVGSEKARKKLLAAQDAQTLYTTIAPG